MFPKVAAIGTADVPLLFGLKSILKNSSTQTLSGVFYVSESGGGGQSPFAFAL